MCDAMPIILHTSIPMYIMHINVYYFPLNKTTKLVDRIGRVEPLLVPRTCALAAFHFQLLQ